MALRLPVAALGALLLSACEIYAVPDPIVCPDVRQGTFDFAGDRDVLASDCFFAQPGNAANQVNNPIAFNGTISFIPGGNKAALCIGAPHAASNLGTYTGLAINVVFETVINLGGCTCPSAAAVTAGTSTRRSMRSSNGPEIRDWYCAMQRSFCWRRQAKPGSVALPHRQGFIAATSWKRAG